MNQWLIIGISGVTCGGKTTLAHSLREFFIAKHNTHIPNTPYFIGDVRLISQDDYFLPVEDPRHQWVQPINVINWEILSSLDMGKMFSDISLLVKDDFIIHDVLLSNSELASRSAFNFHPFQYIPHCHYHNHHHNRNRRVRINVLIIEGFLIFNHPDIRQICQLKFHLHLPYEKCFARRKLRIYNPPDVIGYFEMCVWPMYEKHFAEFKDDVYLLMLNGDLSPEAILKYVINRIFAFL